MVIVICLDGLGGCPEITFGPLRDRLQETGTVVSIVDTTKVVTHQDRVKLILDEYKKYDDGNNNNIFLLGQSAGGSAVRIAAERLGRENKKIAGVIQLSPAMPAGIFFMTKSLFSVMKNRLIDLLMGRSIETTEKEYSILISPKEEGMDLVIKNRWAISGVEARTLAFFPPKFKRYKFPTLHVFGNKDAWISPRAQRKLSKIISKNSSVQTIEIIGAGHLTLVSSEKEKVCATIKEWINQNSD